MLAQRVVKRCCVSLKFVKAFLVSVAVSVFSLSLLAQQDAEHADVFEFESPQQQAQAMVLAKELRCPTCINQNLIESNSAAARDFKHRVFELVKQGHTPKQVKQHMVEIYGEQVLYRSSMSRTNFLLWGLPIIAS